MSALEETIKETIHAHDQMLKRLWCIAYEEGQKAEREACAKVCEEFGTLGDSESRSHAEAFAAAIRSRNEK